MSETALTHFDAARLSLEKASTIDEVKSIRDKAEALRAYARQSGQGLEMQNRCAEIKLRAERRGGEMVAEIERQQGKNGDGLRATLARSEVPLRTAYNWQKQASVPEEKFEAHIAETKESGRELTSTSVRGLVKEIKKQEHRDARTPTSADTKKASQNWRLIHSPCHGLDLPENSIDCIITDPPYPKEYLNCYGDLSKLAAQVLKPGGSCIVMCGQSYLPEVIARLSESLSYHWTLAYLTPGGQSAQLWNRKVNTFWKPLLWFVKTPFTSLHWQGDVLGSDTNDNDKRFHQWGQSESGMAAIVDRFTLPSQVILDPFVGGGTTGVVALNLGRQFIGSDMDSNQIDISRKRLEEIS